MTTWTGAITDKSSTTLETYGYDFRGNLANTITYATVQAGGAGDAHAPPAPSLHDHHNYM